MNIVDIILLVILGVAAYNGYNRGLFVSLVSIFAFFVAIILAFMFMDWGVEVLSNYIDGFTGFMPFLAFLIIFGLAAVLINIGGSMVKKAMDLTLLGSFDKIAGALLGIVKWVVGASLLIWLIQTVGLEIPNNWQESSSLYQKIEPVAPWIIDRFSEYWPFIKDLFESIKERLQPTLI